MLHNMCKQSYRIVSFAAQPGLPGLITDPINLVYLLLGEPAQLSSCLSEVSCAVPPVLR